MAERMPPGWSLKPDVLAEPIYLERLVALEADRARLDWLEHKGTVEIECAWKPGSGDWYAIGDQIDGGENYATLREAIDAAMKQQAAGGGAGVDE